MHNGDELRSVKKAVVNHKSKQVHWCKIPLLAAIIGTLGRKHVQADSVVYIGKEANNIDEQVLDDKKAQEFINEKLVYDFILDLTPENAREIGIKHRSALAYLKKKGKEGDLNFKAKNVRRIVGVLS